MKIDVEVARVDEKDWGMIVIGLFEDGRLEGFAKEVDEVLGGMLSDLSTSSDFKGSLNRTRLIYTQGRLKTKRILLIGLGKQEEFELEAVRVTSGKAALEARELKLSSYATLLFGEGSNLPLDALSQSIVEGCELALYRFDQYKTVKEGVEKEVEGLIILVQNEDSISKVQLGVGVGQITVRGVKLARDIANAPSNDCTPSILADKAERVAKEHDFNCKVLEKSDMVKLSMGGLLGVSQGSQQPPKLIILEYFGAHKDEPPIVLVGKAITFDSGGISIKPSEKMEEMKYDKSGGAAVLATMQVSAELKFPLNIAGIIPATENLPSGTAYKPGDVLRFYNGKTAEIISTDAEGRLILSDALAYAAEYKPQAIIDLATLTGACVIALGAVTTGLLSNNNELKQKVIKSAEATGEKAWELPLWKDYHEAIKSEVADMKNSGGRPAGAITAAAFLSNFVGNYPWAHLDIAGTAWKQEGSVEKTYLPKGATGVGVRLLTHLLRNWDASKPSIS